MGHIRRNSTYVALATVLETKCIPHVVEQKGRHPCLRFEVGERKLRVTFPASPSDWRGARNAVACLRRIIRDAETGC